MIEDSRFGVLPPVGYRGADVLDVKPVTLLGRHLDDCSAVKGELIGGSLGGRCRARLTLLLPWATNFEIESATAKRVRALLKQPTL